MNDIQLLQLRRSVGHIITRRRLHGEDTPLVRTKGQNVCKASEILANLRVGIPAFHDVGVIAEIAQIFQAAGGRGHVSSVTLAIVSPRSTSKYSSASFGSVPLARCLSHRRTPHSTMPLTISRYAAQPHGKVARIMGKSPTPGFRQSPVPTLPRPAPPGYVLPSSRRRCAYRIRPASSRSGNPPDTRPPVWPSTGRETGAMKERSRGTSVGDLSGPPASPPGVTLRDRHASPAPAPGSVPHG